ncbi:GIY-YIG nuclease family protein [Snodgrassella sp. CFCC 13594]|uniref:GIY-YIG nuclease family protein n=1 Tax=Snodgrassella sp. CFCC 13594 TaxID=1775559 RepID=UPI0009EE5BC5|nr:GIY-YIG nuclease family protein [Snodgrassella sp. CFCC 13594]
MWVGESRLPEAIQAALPCLPQPQGEWVVYLLLCANGSLYCGISNHPQQRWQAHVQGLGARFTRMHQPLQMRIVLAHLAKSVAARCEYRLKQLKAEDKRRLWQTLE